MSKLKVTLVKSPIGYPEDQKRTVQALGLKRLRHTVEFEDAGAIRGMVTKVRHLVKVEAVEGGSKGGARKRARQNATSAEEKS